MENILILLAVIVTILVIIAATVGVIAERLPRKKNRIIGYEPPRETLDQMRAKYVLKPVDDTWPNINRSALEAMLKTAPGYIHYVDPAFSINIHTPVPVEENRSPDTQKSFTPSSLAELNNMQRSLEFIRMMYESNPESVSKNVLHDLLNQYAEQCDRLSESCLLLVTKNGKMTTEYKCMKTKLQSARYEIERLQTFEDFANRVSSLPNCNDCDRSLCQYKPKCGEDARFNCPWHVKSDTNYVKPNVTVGVRFVKEN